MKCDKVRELLMTDYIDAELDTGTEQLVREHLAACADCRGLECEVREAGVRGLAGAKRPEPPPYVWNRIREALSAEQPARSRSADFIRGLRHVFALPQMRLAVVTAAMVVIVVAFAVRQHIEERALDLYLEEQATFLSDLGTNGNDMELFPG